jgi:transcriptional regulator with XRE-family HTH domain
MLSVTKLNFAARLRNRVFRRKFFRSSAQEEVAQQIRELRRKLEMRQVDLAKAAHMKQSAVSRIEQADYSRWSFNTILRIADSLDARVRVLFEPANEVIAGYERREVERAKLAKRFESEFRQVPASLPDAQLGSAQTQAAPAPRSPSGREPARIGAQNESRDIISTAHQNTVSIF